MLKLYADFKYMPYIAALETAFVVNSLRLCGIVTLARNGGKIRDAVHFL